MSDAPDIHVPIRRRMVVDPNVPRIERYWKHKEYGITYEVQKFYRAIGEVNKLFVVLLDPTARLEFSVDLKDLRREYEPVGNLSAKF